MLIESPRAPAGCATSVSIEEVHDGESAHTSVYRPHVEEPDEGIKLLPLWVLLRMLLLIHGSSHNAEPQYSHMQQPVRHQAPPQSVMNLFTEPFGYPAFGGMFGGHVGGAPSNGNTFCYMSTMYAQQAPDGTQYTQTSSSAYGPTGVRNYTL